MMEQSHFPNTSMKMTPHPAEDFLWSTPLDWLIDKHGRWKMSIPFTACQHEGFLRGLGAIGDAAGQNWLILTDDGTLARASNV